MIGQSVRQRSGSVKLPFGDPGESAVLENGGLFEAFQLRGPLPLKQRVEDVQRERFDRAGVEETPGRFETAAIAQAARQQTAEQRIPAAPCFGGKPEGKLPQIPFPRAVCNRDFQL